MIFLRTSSFMTSLRWVFTLLFLLGATPVSARGESVRDPSGVKQEREDVRKRLKNLQDTISQTSAERQKVSQTVQMLDSQLEQTGSRLNKLDTERAQLEKELIDLKQQEIETAKALADTQQRMAAVLRNQYRRSDVNPTQAWLSGKPAGQATRESYWYQRLSDAEKALGEQLTAQAEKLNTLRADLEKKRTELGKTITEWNLKQRELKAQKDERQQLAQDLNSKLKDQELEKQRLQRDDKRLSDTINELTQAIEAARKRQAEQQRQAAANSNKQNGSMDRGERESPTITGSGDFEKLKGRLQLPVAGDIVGRYGQTRSSDGKGPAWRGVFIKTPAGVPIRAVYTGKVVFAEWLRGFGQIIILDHGDQYLSVYSNNSKLLKSTGDTVKTGEIVAETGNSSGNLDTGLYFELRHQGQPFDPILWTKGH